MGKFQKHDDQLLVVNVVFRTTCTFLVRCVVEDYVILNHQYTLKDRISAISRSGFLVFLFNETEMRTLLVLILLISWPLESLIVSVVTGKHGFTIDHDKTENLTKSQDHVLIPRFSALNFYPSRTRDSDHSEQLYYDCKSACRYFKKLTTTSLHQSA